MIDEILVHISTPATRQNDDLYRSLADAYLDFEPHRQHGNEVEEKLTGPKILSSSRLEGYVTPVGSSLLSTSRESYGSFPSHISSGGHAEVIGVGDMQSVVHDSIPTSSRLARLDRIHKLWKEKTTPRSSFMGGERPSSRASRAPEDIDTTFIEDTQLGAQALHSQLQDSYSTTDEDTSENEAEAESIIPPQLASSVIFRANETITANTTIEKVEVLRPTPMAALNSISANQRPKSRLSTELKPSPLSTQQSSKKRKTEDPPSEAFDFSKLPTDVFPPTPQISTERPGRLPSQVTKHLATLKTQNPKRFKLSKRHGTPRYDDRGHWLVDSSSWSANMQQEFWDSICENVSSGRLGWGITLYRDTSSPKILGLVRLYCWAEIVEHTWLMMWLCSRGKIVGSSSKWIDADGKVMFEML